MELLFPSQAPGHSVASFFHLSQWWGKNLGTVKHCVMKNYDWYILIPSFFLIPIPSNPEQTCPDSAASMIFASGAGGADRDPATRLDCKKATRCHMQTQNYIKSAQSSKSWSSWWSWSNNRSNSMTMKMNVYIYIYISIYIYIYICVCVCVRARVRGCGGAGVGVRGCGGVGVWGCVFCPTSSSSSCIEGGTHPRKLRASLLPPQSSSTKCSFEQGQPMPRKWNNQQVDRSF